MSSSIYELSFSGRVPMNNVPVSYHRDNYQAPPFYIRQDCFATGTQLYLQPYTPEFKPKYRYSSANEPQAANNAHIALQSALFMSQYTDLNPQRQIPRTLESPIFLQTRESTNNKVSRMTSPLFGIHSCEDTQNSTLNFNTVTLQRTSAPMPQNGIKLQSQGEPKTMAPKDAVLDFNKIAYAGIPPLFPSIQPDFNLGDALRFRDESSNFRLSQNFVSMESFPNQYAQATNVPQYPFTQQQQDRQQPQQLHRTPELPTSLPSLQSTGSETLPTTEITSLQSSITVQPVKEEILRPENTTAEGGTYTCTYHGCALRFETPAKLQKHKREAHRQVSGQDNSACNSQAGPHKCERINPSTGKPCNSVFSRPYDLTRHEDTIHNARKQKVRCHLCTEEKTFSRNDALTRHMRVVHPEVDWPRKQKRRARV